MVADDSRHMIEILNIMLRGMMVQNLRAYTDTSTAKSDLLSFRPDLILCDYNLAPTGGLDLVRFVRTSPDSADQFVPIIMLTAFAEKRTVIKARDAGVTEFLAKPVSASSLYGRIVACIQDPRPFVRAGKFLGPDRRRRIEDFDGEDRRGNGGKKAPVAQAS